MSFQASAAKLMNPEKRSSLYMNPAHNLLKHPNQVHSTVVFPRTPGPPTRSLTSRAQDCNAPHASQLLLFIFLYVITGIIFIFFNINLFMLFRIVQFAFHLPSVNAGRIFN